MPRRHAIIGFGSLLSETSARRTFPNLTGFGVCKIEGYRRVFAHAANVFFERGIARMDTREISSLSVERRAPEDIPHGEPPLVCSYFFIPDDELPGFYKREMEFFIGEVEPLDVTTSAPMGFTGLICERSSDEHFMKTVCNGDPAVYHSLYGRWGVDKIWGLDDVLPCRAYLRHCVLAAEKLGPEVHASFLHATYLCDRTTTIAQHLANDPSIMDELPTEAAAPFYSG
eukprot:TRINITY_DN13181_c0_g1_i1.p1 TRINITY_DN13181_c0_g1~~TRINITY_DN13181_c0_g1_i1.p1  ORF type:complete len:228 (+),score=69.63 TRINITY_DN13181_c0_g1_i1:679-1362(+)